MSVFRVLRVFAAALLAPPLFSAALAQTIALDKEDATVWAQAQVISGTIDGAEAGVLHVNDDEITFTAVDGTFAVDVWLEEEVSSIIACSLDGIVCTDPRLLTLGFTPRPEAELRPVVNAGVVELVGAVLDHPRGGSLSFVWEVEDGNPAVVMLTPTTDSTATVAIAPSAPPGEYYFAWTVADDQGGEITVRTFVTKREDGEIVPFVIEEDAASWIDDATVYGIAPYYFVRSATQQNQSFNAIRQKLPEIASLGINTLWLQPVFTSPGGGHSYDVANYFEITTRFGTENDLRDLIADARELGLRVIFDLPPNHSSILHPFAQDAIEHGPRSHYFEYYQREFDNAPYSQHYNYRHEGQMTFVYYFWEYLPNFDFSNPEVRRHMIEAARYWVEEFGIDGYRFDAPWGLDARTPDFISELRAALKRIRPDVLLLGEDKASLDSRFDNRYDVAYDWAPGEGWVSQWMWQAHYSSSSNPTIFNHTLPGLRAQRLRQALTNFGDGWAEDARVFRFIENNDTFRFLPTHDLDRTKMAAALLFALPGMPLIYNGQEIGIPHHPFTQWTVFAGGSSIQAQDQHGLFPYYHHLLQLREAFAALRSPHWDEVAVNPLSVAGRALAFRRWSGADNVIGVINMGEELGNAVLSLPVAEMGLEEGTTYYLTDLFSGEAYSGELSDLASWNVSVPGYTTRLFAVADSTVAVPVPSEPPPPSRPLATALDQNYPNPFGDRTSVVFEVREAGHARLRVVDVLGRQVAVLVDEEVLPGRHEVTFDARGLASGTYIAILEAAGARRTRQMMIVR